ncbi:uncharacterized protein G2W53_013129 [Senna tora]|uniref:Uncharacterized protein n=1 Tax=Senna tora TaxID=362788 RepID=A0A834WS33_9FABA|nr:uncharacterized protein G2W53_013129 [Senna tora]
MSEVRGIVVVVVVAVYLSIGNGFKKDFEFVGSPKLKWGEPNRQKEDEDEDDEGKRQEVACKEATGMAIEKKWMRGILGWLWMNGKDGKLGERDEGE